MVFDISRKATYTALQNWYTDLSENCDVKRLTIAIAANKSDLQHQVSEVDVKRYAAKLGVEYFTISAKTGEGIEGSLLN